MSTNTHLSRDHIRTTPAATAMQAWECSFQDQRLVWELGGCATVGPDHTCCHIVSGMY